MKPIDIKSFKINFKNNFLFFFSAVAFFCLNMDLYIPALCGTGVALLFCFFFTIKKPYLWQILKNSSVLISVISFLSSIGICLKSGMLFFERWSVSSAVNMLEDMLPFSVDLPLVTSIIGGIFAFLFIFLCVNFFWIKVKEIFIATKIFDNIKIFEMIIYFVIFVLFFAVIVFSFTHSQAFYKTEHFYDIIYTSDSPFLVKGNAYLTLYHPENDIRQPLFAVFSAPFTGFPYLLSKVLKSSPCGEAIFLNIVQLVLLFVSSFIYTKILNFSPVRRICFLLICLSTYSTILFSLMMEQYVVAYFWLTLCILAICKKFGSPSLVFCGASGTLLTSAALLPLISKHTPLKDFKNWFLETFHYGLIFVANLFFFGRTDIFLGLTNKVNGLISFTSDNLSTTDKLIQFSHFVSNCFTAPDAGVDLTSLDHPSWQLAFPTKFNIVGITIFSLAIISIIVNRKKIISQVSAVWIAFSFVMLVVLGWGTSENGLILYSLYFGWPYLVLLFQLAEKIEEKLRVKFVIPILSVIACVGMLIINIPAFKEMLDFAITYYPA